MVALPITVIIVAPPTITKAISVSKYMTVARPPKIKNKHVQIKGNTKLILIFQDLKCP